MEFFTGKDGRKSSRDDKRLSSDDNARQNNDNFHGIGRGLEAASGDGSLPSQHKRLASSPTNTAETDRTELVEAQYANDAGVEVPIDDVERLSTAKNQGETDEEDYVHENRWPRNIPLLIFIGIVIITGTVWAIVALMGRSDSKITQQVPIKDQVETNPPSSLDDTITVSPTHSPLESGDRDGGMGETVGHQSSSPPSASPTLLPTTANPTSYPSLGPTRARFPSTDPTQSPTTLIPSSTPTFIIYDWFLAPSPAPSQAPSPTPTRVIFEPPWFVFPDDPAPPSSTPNPSSSPTFVIYDWFLAPSPAPSQAPSLTPTRSIL